SLMFLCQKTYHDVLLPQNITILEMSTDNKQVVSQLTQQKPKRILVVAPSELTIHHRHRQSFPVLPT
ncbi:MAG: hypothetical protein RM347_030175, partial [Nostoc sp. ChiQUE02]